MKIGILGSGTVGTTIGAALAKKGHEVVLGTRDPKAAKVLEWAKAAGKGASVGTFEDAAKHGEVIFLCTLWSGTENAIQLAKPENAAGKVVVDVTNPLDFADGKPKLAVGHTTSGAELVQKWFGPKAKVVKALNQVTASTMVSAQREEGTPDMFIAGDDSGAKATVTTLLQAFGWSVIDLGGLTLARYLEPLAMIWVSLWGVTKSGNHAFKLLRK